MDRQIDNLEQTILSDATNTSERAALTATIAGPIAASMLARLEPDPSQDAIYIVVARANTIADKLITDARNEFPLNPA